MSKLAPLAELSAFEALDPAQRLALAAPLAESLGQELVAHAILVGHKGMIALDHPPTGLRFVVIPGGSFDMGLSDADVDEASECVTFTADVQRWVQAIEASATRRTTGPPQRAWSGGPKGPGAAVDGRARRAV